MFILMALLFCGQVLGVVSLVQQDNSENPTITIHLNKDQEVPQDKSLEFKYSHLKDGKIDVESIKNALNIEYKRIKAIIRSTIPDQNLEAEIKNGVKTIAGENTIEVLS